MTHTAPPRISEDIAAFLNRLDELSLLVVADLADAEEKLADLEHGALELRQLEWQLSEELDTAIVKYARSKLERAILETTVWIANERLSHERHEAKDLQSSMRRICAWVTQMLGTGQTRRGPPAQH